MSIDLSQFHQVFFEESFEGLDIMESGLLDLDIDNPDDEVINSIFRAAHSIKGGAGTFGFSSVADFTHVMETLLDEVRDGKRGLDKDSVELFLVSVDCLKGMFEHLQNDEEPDLTQSKELITKFETLLNGESTSDQVVDGAGGGEEPPEEHKLDQNPDDGGWKIYFKPNEDMLKSGNEPIRMFREIASIDQLARLNVEVDASQVPNFESLHPEDCYLAWDITIQGGNIQQSDLEEVFEWVVDDCELKISAIQSEPSPATAKESSDEDNAPSESVAATTNSDSSPDDQLEQQATNSKTDQDAQNKATPNKPEKTKKPVAESTSIRVSIDKVDTLINMVGELVITQSMLGELGRKFEMTHMQRLQEGLGQLESNTRELQESVMKIRMMPISFVFSRFPRLVRDLGNSLGKDIELTLLGETTELDKTVMEKIGDPMVHLVRNSIDHGIESKESRQAVGKSPTGKIVLNAFHQGGNIVIEITDDGAGLNTEKIYNKAVEKGLISAEEKLSPDQVNDLIFRPGFSTADVVSDISGRGVGMDVVRRNIQELNGSIEVLSKPGEGSVFTIRLPLTLAILDGQLIRVGTNTYIFPLVSIVESIQMNTDILSNVGGSNNVLKIRDEYVPILHLHEVFNIEPDSSELANSLVVIVETDGRKMGIVVDELLGQQQVVIKSMEQNYKKVEGVSGATILGDGTVSMIIDIAGISTMATLPDGGHDKVA